MTKSVQEFRGLAADSRQVRPGFLFAALPGTKLNGARFIDDAVKRGAIAILGVPDAAEEARKSGVRFIADHNPRLRLAKLAASFYRQQPAHIAAVTGTSGKTSVVTFLRQIWMRQGRAAASLGTLGLTTPAGEVKLHHTTPDPVEIHAALAKLKRDGIDWLAMEASSHGLDQYRLDGVAMGAVGFTNISREHLDYHPDFAHYLHAKLRLFAELAPPGAVAVVNADAAHAKDFIATAKARGLKLLTVGEAGEALKLTARTAHADGQALRILYRGRPYDVALPLAGAFQASNALVAAALAIGLGDPVEKVFASLETLTGAPGRLEKIAYGAKGAPIYVDYAHKPDALETVLTTLRPHIAGKLHVVFGCGGDRDAGKRPIMGEIAARLADAVIVTDDNPRSEDASAIRRAILARCPGAREIADRAEAISVAVAALGPEDTLVVAGKGHEEGQIVGDTVRPFSDRIEAVKAAIASGGRVVETNL